MKKAFSLVELSIVLVILGLLTGGILAGQSLIRAAELRSATADFQRFTASMYVFRDKCLALPGDMNNAQLFWGVQHATPGTCATTASSTTATCNGDGNGRIQNGSGPFQEEYRAWQHLANAGLIEGHYTGVPDTGPNKPVPGTNVPASKLGDAAWSIAYADITYLSGSGASYWGPAQDGNTMFFGGVNGDLTRDNDILKPEEAWNIDTKLDDGLPGSGRILGEYPNSSCHTGGTAPSAYNVSSSNKICALRFVIR